jgi:hypothetical protein
MKSVLKELRGTSQAPCLRYSDSMAKDKKDGKKDDKKEKGKGKGKGKGKKKDKK